MLRAFSDLDCKRASTVKIIHSDYYTLDYFYLNLQKIINQKHVKQGFFLPNENR
jgi:hypothetical protein